MQNTTRPKIAAVEKFSKNINPIIAPETTKIQIKYFFSSAGFALILEMKSATTMTSDSLANSEG
jgi:hypothetical protein